MLNRYIIEQDNDTITPQRIADILVDNNMIRNTEQHRETIHRYLKYNTPLINIQWLISAINKLDNPEVSRYVANKSRGLVKYSNGRLSFRDRCLLKKIRKCHCGADAGNTPDTDDEDTYTYPDNCTCMKYSDDQQRAIKYMTKFIANDKQYIWGLYGSAGTGKTTVSVEFITFLIRNRYVRSVTMVAPTNKAVNIIKTKFRDNLIRLYHELFGDVHINDFDMMVKQLETKGIYVSFMTIHALLSYKNDYRTDGVRIFHAAGKKSKINRYDMVVVDECSMLSYEMMANIMEEVLQFKRQYADNGLKMIKIIFLGDKCQLPPVSENMSIVFTEAPYEC